jgi:hypothetical protein
MFTTRTWRFIDCYLRHIAAFLHQAPRGPSPTVPSLLAMLQGKFLLGLTGTLQPVLHGGSLRAANCFPSYVGGRGCKWQDTIAEGGGYKYAQN